MRAVLAPYNFAGQPVLVTNALRSRGVDATHLLYAWKWRADYYDFESDRVVEVNRSNWLEVELGALNQVIADKPDVVHLWNRSLICPPGGFGFLSGLDLPFLKAAGIRIVYRFTGYDLRQAELDKRLNPYSPLLHGYEAKIDEQAQHHYLDHLRQWVDCFVVQDPEMHAHMPEAEVVPRAIDLEDFPYVGVERSARPLIVHAPSSRVIKGTDGVLEAIEALRRRGLEFDFKLIEKLSHREAAAWYRRADILVDQLRIGWYGVLGVEGMALGKPVVAYVRPGLAEQIDRPLPVVSATLDDLADRLEELIRDPERRVELGRRGRRFTEEVHDVRAVAAAIERIYERVVESPRPVADAAPHHLAALAPQLQEALAQAQRFETLRGEYFELRHKAAAGNGHKPGVARRMATAVANEAMERVPALQDAARAAPWLIPMARRDPIGAARVVTRRVRLEAVRARRRRRKAV